MGEGEGKGYNLNIPLPPGTGDEGYFTAWEQVVEPVFHEYQPDLVMLSAGYDAHQQDPLAEQRVTTQGYSLMAGKLLKLADSHNAKIFSILEGGYNTEALADSVAATIRAFKTQSKNSSMEDSIIIDNTLSKDLAHTELLARLKELKKLYAPIWKSLK
jgi:acetoin utilization deacetylase AcuC-like enzyme